MPFPKPSEVLRWAQDALGTVAAGRVVSPNTGKKDVGFSGGETLPAEYLNYLFNLAGRWTGYLQDFEAYAHTWLEAHVFQQNVEVQGNATVGGTLGVGSNTTVGGTLQVTSNATVGGTLNATGNATLGGSLQVGGRVTGGGYTGSTTVDAAGTAQATSYVFASSALPTTAGATVPLGAFRTTAGPNTISLSPRTWNAATVTGWENVKIGFALDVDGTPAAGGFLRLGQSGVEVGGHLTASATTRTTVLRLTTGDVSFDGVANPNSNVAFSNQLAPKNICKAWARVSHNGSGGVAVDDGFNIASIALSSGLAQLTFATPFANSFYAVVVTNGSFPGQRTYYVTQSTTVCLITMVDSAGAFVSMATSAGSFSVVCFGAQ